VVTAAYYTFSGRLWLMFIVIETPASDVKQCL